MKRLLSYAVLTLGLLTAVAGLALLGAAPILDAPFERGTWLQIMMLGIFGSVPLIASALAIRHRRAGAIVYIAGAPSLLVSASLFDISTLPVAAIVALWFCLLGGFWFLSERKAWPSLLSAPLLSTLRGIVALGTAAVSFVVLTCSAAIGWNLSRPEIGDCGEPPPFVRQRFPSQAVLVAKVVHVDPILGTVALVKEEFWGLPKWNHRFVFLKHGSLGETYFISGRRAEGLLTRVLSVLETHCTRTKVLSQSAIDMRVLHDRHPRPGARIIGEVIKSLQSDSPYQYRPVRGITITVLGPLGSRTAVTDAEGIYDLPGLPSGTYSVRAEPLAAADVSTCEKSKDLKSDQIWSCNFLVR